MYANRIAALLFAVSILLASGCAQTSLDRDAVTFAATAGVERDQPLAGLAQRFDTMRGPDAIMRVFVVNGMATAAHGYSFDFQKKVAARLGQSACREDRVIALDRPAFILGRSGGDWTDYPPATLRVTTWAQDSGATSRLVFYEVLWTPYVDAMTDEFIAPFETDLRYATEPAWSFCKGEPEIEERRVEGAERPKRAALNSAIKEGIMIGGFTDAILSVGPLGAAARDAIRQGLCVMAADALSAPARPSDDPRCRLTQETLERFGGTDGVGEHLRQHEFAFLTYSLGSFMLLDSLDEFRLWPGDLGPPELTCRLMPPLLDETPIFMFSNQISLLLAAHPQFGCDPDEDCNLYGEFGGHRQLLADPRARGRRGDHETACRIEALLSIVAFNDPNDVMGYHVPDYLTESPLIGRVINVRVRNPAFRLPGLFVSPAGAHTRHGENPAILDFILNGWPPPP